MNRHTSSPIRPVPGTQGHAQGSRPYRGLPGGSLEVASMAMIRHSGGGMSGFRFERRVGQLLTERCRLCFQLYVSM